MSFSTAGTAQHHFVIRKCTAYCFYLVISSANGSSQHHGKEISLGIKSVANSLNSVSLESLLVILSEASKKQSQSHTADIPPIWSLLFLHSPAYFALVERRAAPQVAGRGSLPPRPAWKKAQKADMGEKQPKRNFSYFELKLYKLSGGTWKH